MGRIITTLSIAVFAGIGERSREELELWQELKERGYMDRTTMIFGQMNEPPGARFLVGLAALSVAEYFRDVEKKDVLFLVDNVYRHVQAGMSVFCRPFTTAKIKYFDHTDIDKAREWIEE